LFLLVFNIYMLHSPFSFICLADLQNYVPIAVTLLLFILLNLCRFTSFVFIDVLRYYVIYYFLLYYCLNLFLPTILLFFPHIKISAGGWNISRDYRLEWCEILRGWVSEGECERLSRVTERGWRIRLKSNKYTS